MKVVDTREYVGMLKELTEEGKEVSMLVFGSSMAPFLIHARDMIYFKKPDRELQKGDIVFFRRKSGQFVMHRIWKIRPEGYYIVGDAQTQIEGPVKREQIFALITKVRRKEKWLEPGDFWWEFFEHVWLHMIPLQSAFFCIKSIYNVLSTIFRKSDNRNITGCPDGIAINEAFFTAF